MVLERQGGLEIALRGMLISAGLRRVPSAGAPAEKGDMRVRTDALTLFKALQVLHAGESTPLERYVTFDFETTDADVATCGVVEIGAARVVNGEIVDRFHTLVNPYRPISTGASKVHGYTDADVASAPSFPEVWPQFRAFVGDDILIAHNGQSFDIPVLRRLAAGREGIDSLVFYDTLPLVRSLSRDSGSQENIAARFGIDVGRAHHALDDAVTLAKIYQVLEKQRVVRARKAVLVNVLDYLGLALALEGDGGRGTGEKAMLFDRARFYALGRYSDALEFYETERERTGADAPSVDELIERLGGAGLRAKLAAEPDPAQRYPAALARLRALMAEPSPQDTLEGIDRLLERIALSTSDGVQAAPDRVNLLTLHSTKGLEFSRVYVVGVEDFELPGWRATTDGLQDEIEEARRLLYVGMTRARDRLVLTRVEQRFGRDSGGSQLLEEMALTVEEK